MTKAIKMTKRTHDRAPDAEPATPYVDLAGEAVLAGMTGEQVVAQLVSRIKRDQGYLAYRKASGRKTRYDDQVTSDLRALALAAVLLDEQVESAATAEHVDAITRARDAATGP